ncbi:hypothetical protein CCACVL1_25361 [Corchorus capsularis]|uniref:Uncharacterized protein n=1 Tax=Corchorus capsularis TaxID=210143 RepID=A0A1R3GL05_COCAP|nr:hypothetical protein CCACVL1_25361 [Corchorus capsularis]
MPDHHAGAPANLRWNRECAKSCSSPSPSQIRPWFSPKHPLTLQI